jgi:ribonuclease HI
MKKKKFYVVWHGLKPGIYDSWKECEAQVKGFTGAKYAGFENKAQAQYAFNSDPALVLNNRAKPATVKMPQGSKGSPLSHSIAVDAACSGNPGVMEYQGVFTDTGTQIFKQGPFPEATNNIGEFLAIVHALAWLKKQNLDLPVYSDSRNAILWVRNKKVNTKLVRRKKNEKVFELIERALSWLDNNEYSTPILKWETAEWGEIPADFGRK